MKKIVLLLFSSISFGLYAAGTPEKVVFLNTGKMYIKESNDTSMYVVNSVKCALDANITLDGVWKIGGNFIQDSEANVFAIDGNGYTESAGTLVFTSQVNPDTTVRRYITTTDFTAYNRASQYIAFPNIQIDTNDTIVVSSQMGIDALSVLRSGKKGFLLLESGITEHGAVYDASLRITGKGSSEELVAPGSVVVEQYMGAYRNGSNPQLFPFASPFKNTQKSGYFAGNWVRRLLYDDMHHVTYVLGNKPGNNGIISHDQYLTQAVETFQPGYPYLIKPRPDGFSYAGLKAEGGLAVTGKEASLYDLEKFTFNGEVYSITPCEEQLFADDTLVSFTPSPVAQLANTVNWVIGNSYTAPLSVQAIAEVMEASTLTFLPYIYIYTPGSGSYQAVNLSEDYKLGPLEYNEIPSKSIFMVRLAKGTAIPDNEKAKFTIGKDQLIQGNASHNYLLRSSQMPAGRDVSFRVTPEENENVYDLAVVGLRAAASFGNDLYDIPKVYDPAKHGFQLYTKTAANSMLSANGMPLEADSVLLNFKSQPEEIRYTLTVSQEGDESGLWLKDLKTNTITDLQQTPSYTFAGKGADLEDRFIVYFTNPGLPRCVDVSTSSISSNSNIYVNFPDNRLSISGLTGADMDSNIFIYDMQGKIVFSGVVSQYPLQEFNIALPKNVYMISIQGQRNFNRKIIK